MTKNKLIRFMLWLIVKPFYWLWAPLGLICIGLTILLLTQGSLNGLLTLSIICQIMGVFFVIAGLNRKLNEFSDFSIGSIPPRWWKERPIFRGKSVVLEPDNLTQRQILLSPESIAESDYKNLSVEGKLRALKNQIDSHNRINQEFRNHFGEINQNIKNTESHLKSGLKTTEKNISRGITGDYELEFFGAMSILIGLSFSVVAVWIT